MTTHVEITGSSRYNEWKKGEKGVVDGYVRGANDLPYAVVILDGSGAFVLVDTHSLKAISK